MTYKWQGGVANGGFVRTGNRNTAVPGDAERGRELFSRLAAELFWCERCHGRHPLAQMSECEASS